MAATADAPYPRMLLDVRRFEQAKVQMIMVELRLISPSLSHCTPLTAAIPASISV